MNKLHGKTRRPKKSCWCLDIKEQVLASSCPQTCSCSPPTWLIHFPNTPHFCLPPFWKSQMPDSICALFYSWYHCLSHSANLSYCCSSYITCGLASWGSHNGVSKLSSVKGLLADVLGLWKPCSFTTTWCCLCSTKAVISSTCTIGQLARFGLYPSMANSCSEEWIHFWSALNASYYSNLMYYFSEV